MQRSTHGRRDRDLEQGVVGIPRLLELGNPSIRDLIGMAGHGIHVAAQCGGDVILAGAALARPSENGAPERFGRGAGGGENGVLEACMKRCIAHAMNLARLDTLASRHPLELFTAREVVCAGSIVRCARSWHCPGPPRSPLSNPPVPFADVPSPTAPNNRLPGSSSR